MGENHLVLGDEGGEGRHGRLDVALLDGRLRCLVAFQKGVTAEGDKQPHPAAPRMATIRALMVWSRFSAWSKTTEAGDSKTSSVTSSPPKPKVARSSLPVDVSLSCRAGRQCMKQA